MSRGEVVSFLVYEHAKVAKVVNHTIGVYTSTTPASQGSSQQTFRVMVSQNNRPEPHYQNGFRLVEIFLLQRLCKTLYY